MSKHTPEPLRVWRDGHGKKSIRPCGPGGVVTGPSAVDVAGDVDTINRLVACYNGCAGIANPEAVGELLAATKRLADRFEFVSEVILSDPYENRKVLASARDAIKKARGEP